MKRVLLFLALLGLAGCLGQGNEELAKQTFGLQIVKVAGDNQVLENPMELANQELVVKVLNTNGEPVKNTVVTFTLDNPESGAAVLSRSAQTDEEGVAKTQVRGGDDFGKVANILAKVNQTSLTAKFLVLIRDKVIPEFIKIVPPSPTVAGIPTSIQLRLEDRNGRLSFEDEFQPKVRVVFNSPAGNHSNASRFNPVNSADRVVEFKGGIAWLNNVWAHKAEDVVIQLEDPGEIADLEEYINRKVDISDAQVLKIVPAAPVRMELEDPPDATTDDEVPVYAKLYDQYDNHAYNYANACAVDIRLIGDRPEVKNTTYSDPKTGRMNFASGTGSVIIFDTKVETVQIRMEKPSNCGAINEGNPGAYASAQDIYFGPGAPAQIVLMDPPMATQSVDYPVSMSLEVQDAGGNHVNNYAGTVKITHSGAQSYIPTAGVVNDIVSIVNGAATFDVRDKLVEQVVVGLEDVAATGMDVSSTKTLNFTVGAAKQFAFSAPTFYGDADNGVDVEVEVWDQYGNLLSNWAGGSVTIVGTGSSDAAGSGKTLTFGPNETKKSIKIIDRVAENISLSFANAGSTLLTSNDDTLESARTRFNASANIKWGIVKKIEIEDPSDGTVDAPVEVTLKALDHWGNIVQDFTNADVRLEANKSATNSGVVNINNGLGSRPISDLVNETVDLKLSLRAGVTELKNSLGEDIDISSTQDVYFKWGAPVKFVLIDPADGSVDHPIQLKAQVKDRGENLVLDYAGSVNIKVDRNAHHNAYESGSKSKTFTFNGSSGEVAGDIYDKVAETVTVSLEDSAGTGLELGPAQTVVFSPGEVVAFKYDPAPTVSVDESALLRVKSFDQFDNHNVSLTEAAAVTLRWVNKKNAFVTPNPAILDIDFDQGVGEIKVGDHTAETVRVGLASKPGLDTSSELDVEFLPGEVREIAILPPPAASITTDNPVTVNLEARDQYGNHNTFYEEDIVFIVNNNANIPGSGKEKTVDISGGAAAVTVEDKVAELVNLSLRDDAVPNRGLILKAVDVTFLPGAPTQYKITSAPDGTVDNPVSIVVQAQDKNGNRVMVHQDDVKVVISEGKAALDTSLPDTNFSPDGLTKREAVVDIENGQGSLFLTDRVAETVKLHLENVGGQAMDLLPGGSDAHETVVFSHGTPFKYEFLPLAVTPNTDGPFNIDVVARDRWNNLADTYSGDVSLRVDKNATVAESNDKVTKVIVKNGEGFASIEDKVVESGVLATLGNELASNAGGLDTSDTLLFNVTFGAPNYFAIVNPTGTATTDAAYPVTIEVRDKNHNVVTSGFTGDVTFKVNPASEAFIGTPGNQSKLVDFANNGNGVETVYVSNHKAEEVGLFLEAILGEMPQDVEDKKNPLEPKRLLFKAGTVRQFEVVADSCSTVDLECDVTVHSLDQYGNHNMEYAASNAIKLQFNAGSSAYFVGGVSDVSFSSGEGVMDIGNTKHEIVTVSMANQSGGTYTFGSNSYDIYFKYGAPAKYKFRTPATTPTTDDPVKVEVAAEDQFGNLVAEYGSEAGQDVEMTVVSGGDAVSGAGMVSNFTAGVGSRDIAKTVVGSLTLGLANANDSLNVSDTLTLNFEHGAVSYFTFINPGEDWSVDVPHNLRVEARDKNHNLATSFGGATRTVDLVYASGGAKAGGNGNYAFNNGFFEATLTNETAEITTMSLQNPSSAGVDVSNTVNIKWVAGEPNSLVVLAQGGPNYTVDDTPNMRVEAQDQYGNFSNKYNGAATFTVNKNAFIYNAVEPMNHGLKSKSISFSSGVANVAIEDWTAETGVEVSVSAASDPGIVNYTPAIINFGHGGAARYFLSSNDGTVDAPVTVNLLVHDRGGNIVKNMPSHSIKLKADRATADFIPASGEVTLINGEADLQLTSTVAEVVTVTIDNAAGAPVPQTSITGVKTEPKFDPGFVREILIASPANAVAGAPINSVSLRAVDQYGNVNNINEVSYSIDVIATKDGTSNIRTTIPVTISGGETLITPSFTIAEDIRFSMANLSPTTNLANQNIIATDDSVTTIEPSNPVKLAFLPHSNDSVDNYITITIQVQDEYDNRVTASSDQVAEFYLASASGQANFKAGQPNLTGQLFTIKSGEGSFNLYNTRAENVTVGMRLPSSNPPNKTNLNLANDIIVEFSAGAPKRYAIIPPGSSTVVDQPTFKVAVYDQYSNLVPGVGTAGNPGRVKIDAIIAGGSVEVEHKGDSQVKTKELEVVNGEATVAISTEKAGIVKLQLLLSDLTDPLGLAPDSAVHEVIFDAGPVDYIVMLDPMDATVDTSGVDVTLQSFDVFGNPTTGFAGQSLKIEASGHAKFVGTTPAVNNRTVSFSGGIATAQVVNQKAETINLTLAPVDTYFSNNGIDISATQDLKFDPGAVTKLALDGVPSEASVDAALPITVKAYDQYDNWQNLPTAANDFEDELVVKVSSTHNKSVVNEGSDTATVSFTNGSASFSIHNPISEATSITLVSSASNFSLGPSATVAWRPGVVDFIAMADPSDVTVDETATVQLEARDKYCNLNTSFNSESVRVDYSPKNSPETVLMSPAAGDDVVFSSGGATFFVENTKVQTIDLTLSAGSNLSGGIKTSGNCISPTGVVYKSTQNIAFGPGAPKKYRFTESTIIQGPTINVDVPVEVEVKALDQHDNVVTYFTHEDKLGITNDSPTGSFIGVPVSFTAGVGSFKVKETKTGTFNIGMSLDPGDLGLGIATDTTQIKFDHGAARKFEIDVPGNTYSIDDDMVVTVRAQDQYGNHHDDYDGLVTVKTPSSTHPFKTGESNIYYNGIAEKFTSGIGEFKISSLKAEETAFKVTAADTWEGAGLTVNQQKDITFIPGAGTQMQIQPAATKTVDVVNTVSIHALDRGDNLAIGEMRTAAATLTISGVGSSDCSLNKEGETVNNSQSISFDLVAGVGLVDVRCEKVGTYTLTLSSLPTSWTIKDGSEPIEFTYGGVKKVAFVEPTPTLSKADESFNFAVEAQDQFGNLVEGYSGRVKIVDKSGGNGVDFPEIPGLSPGVVSLSEGKANLNGIQVTTSDQIITFGFEAVSGFPIPDLTDTVEVTIVHGAPVRVTLAALGEQTAGEFISAHLRTEDNHGNLCNTTNYTVDFKVTSEVQNDSIWINGDESTGIRNGVGAEPHQVNVVNGVATVTLWSTLAQQGSVTLADASNEIETPTTGRSFKFTPGAATQIGFINTYINATTDDKIELELVAKDQYGNLDKKFSSNSIQLTANPGGNLVDPISTPVTFTNGEATYTVQNKRPETVTIGLNSSSMGSLSGEPSSDQVILSIAVGAPDRYSLGSMPTDITADDVGVAQLTVHSYDQWDNPAPSSDSVIMATTGSARFDGTGSNEIQFYFSGTDTLSATLSSTVAETVTIFLKGATGGMDLVNASKPLIIKHGAPAKFEFKSPTPSSPKTDISAKIDVELLDKHGNRCKDTTNQKIQVSAEGSGAYQSEPNGDGEKTFVDGIASYTISSSTKQEVTLSGVSSGLTATNDGTINFGWGAPNKLVFTNPPVKIEIEKYATITAEMRDSAGNWLQEYSGDVKFSQNSFIPSGTGGGGEVGDGPSGFNTLSSSNGRFVFSSITSQLAGNLSVAVSDETGSAATGTTSIEFSPGGASHVLILPQNDDAIITGHETVQLLVLDKFFNISNYNGDLSVQILPGSDESLDDGYFENPGEKSRTVSVNGGTASFRIRKLTAGLVGITVEGSPSLIQVEEFNFLPGHPVEYFFLTPSYLSGESFTDGCVDCHGSTDGPVAVEIHAVDLMGTRSGDYNGSVEVFIKTDPNGQSAYGGKRVNFTEGKATITIGNSTAETIQLGVRLSRNVDGSPNTDLAEDATLALKFGKGKVERIKLTLEDSEIWTGVSTTLNISAIDAQGDTVTSYRGNFDLMTGSSNLVGGSFSIVDGVAEMELGSTKAGTYNLSLADTSNTGLDLEQATLVIRAKDPRRIPLYCDNITVTTEERIYCRIYLEDNYLNRVHNWVGSVAIMLEDSEGNPAAAAEVYDAQTGGSLVWSGDADNDGVYDGGPGYIVNFNNGNKSEQRFYIRSKLSGILKAYIPGGAKAGLNLTGGAASPSVSTTWNASRFFAPAEPAKLELETPIANATAGDSATITVKAYTASGELAQAHNGYVYVRVVSDPGEPSASVAEGGLLHMANGVGSLTVSNTQPETITIALERLNSSQNDIELVPDKALSQSANIVFEPDAPAKLAIDDPGTGTSGLPLPVTVSLKDANGNPSVNNTGAPIVVTVSSDDSEFVVSGSPVTIPAGAASASFSVTADVSGSANITASHASLTDATRAISFNVGAVTKLAHTGTYEASDDGTVTVELEALSAEGVRNTDYSGSFGVNVHNGASGSISANIFINFTNGVGSMEIKSTRAQTVEFEIYDFMSLITMPENVSLVFNKGAASKLTIATQPVANVKEGETFFQAGVFNITDDDGTLIAAAGDLITVEAFKGAGCSGAPSGVLSGTLSKAAAGGSATFSDLSYSVAEEISIKASAGDYASACSNVTEVFGELNVTAQAGPMVSVGEVVTIVAKGGTQPTTFALATNNSGGELGAPYACETNKTCVDYTAGLQGASFDMVVATDSAAANQSVNFMVVGAKLGQSGGDAHFGAIDLYIDKSEAFTFTNEGASLTGAITVSWSANDDYAEDESLMWHVNDTNCAGANLAPGSSCQVIVDFLGASGPGEHSAYSGVLTVQGADGGVAQANLSALLAPRLSLVSGNSDFGSAAGQETFVFENLVQGSTTGALTAQLEALTGDDCSGFAIRVHTCSTLDDATTCGVTLDFEPDAYAESGSYTCSLSLDANNAEKVTIPLVGAKP